MVHFNRNVSKAAIFLCFLLFSFVKRRQNTNTVIWPCSGWGQTKKIIFLGYPTHKYFMGEVCFWGPTLNINGTFVNAVRTCERDRLCQFHTLLIQNGLYQKIINNKKSRPPASLCVYLCDNKQEHALAKRTMGRAVKTG